MGTSETTVKYTAVLPVKFVAALKELASQKVIPSVNYGIREAIEQFLADCRREIYAQRMAEAAKDRQFMDRTLESLEAFKHADNEVSGQW